MSLLSRQSWRARRRISAGAFVLLILAAAALLFVVSREVFLSSEADSFGRIAAHATLQLCFVVVLGGLIKLSFDYAVLHQSRFKEDQAKRGDLLRRLRAQHVRVAQAQHLIAAHKTVKTYDEQLRSLASAVFELEDIVEDLRAANDLFGEDHQTIMDGVRDVALFLRKGIQEYRETIARLDPHATGEKFTRVTADMAWLTSFEDPHDLPREYVDALTRSKEIMRKHVFGGNNYVPPPAEEFSDAPSRG